jgi:hypothetical protein
MPVTQCAWRYGKCHNRAITGNDENLGKRPELSLLDVLLEKARTAEFPAPPQQAATCI